MILTGQKYAVYTFAFEKKVVALQREVTKKVYFIGNERMLIAHDSNRLRFS